MLTHQYFSHNSRNYSKKMQRYISTTASNLILNNAKLVVGIICDGEDVKDRGAANAFVING